jgi:hypothetical protein
MTAERDKEREHERLEGWGDTPSLPQALIGVYLEAKAGLLAAVGMNDSAFGMSELLCIERLCINFGGRASIGVRMSTALDTYEVRLTWIRFDGSCLYFAHCNTSTRAIFVRVSSLRYGLTALNEWFRIS